MTSFQVGTWNLDGYRRTGKLPEQVAVLEALCADVLVLTEVSDRTRLEGKHSWWSAPGQPPQYKPHHRAVGVFSGWAGVPLEVSDSRLSVCVALTAPKPLGLVLVYGTIIPYHDDGVRQGQAARWERHRKAIGLVLSDIKRIRCIPNYSSAHFILAGDFNTNLDGKGRYGDPVARQALMVGLEQLGLVCHTLEDIKATRGSCRSIVDHICMSEALQPSKPLHIWCDREGPGRLSDHNGVSVNFNVNVPRRRP